MDKLKQFDTPKTYLTLSGLLAGYLLLLLFQSFFNNQIGKLSVLITALSPCCLSFHLGWLNLTGCNFQKSPHWDWRQLLSISS